MHLLALCLGLVISNLAAQGEIEKLPALVNTQSFDESTPVVSADGTTLFFTRTAYPEFNATLVDGRGQAVDLSGDSFFPERLSGIYSQLAGQKIEDPVASPFNQDIWLVRISDDDEIIKLEHPPYPLNSALPNCLLSRGMKTGEYVILNQFSRDGSMYSGFSRVDVHPDGVHTFPRPMHIYQFDVVSSNVNLTMTADGHVLLISMQGVESRGANDLYVSFFVRDNLWSIPVNIGDVINSPYQETAPHLSADKRYLYFSSNRPGGKGGNDIYVAERLDYTWLKWSAPRLYSGMVNTSADETQPFFDPRGNYFYFVSRRDGSSDIFRERLTPRPRLEKPIVVRGQIVNDETGKPMRGELFWGPDSADDYLEYFNSYNGEFELTLTEYESYKFETRKPNHASEQIIVDATMLDAQGKDTVDLVIRIKPKAKVTNDTASTSAPLVVAETNINTVISDPSFFDIQFVRSEATILKQSFPALEYLLKQMNQHADLEILVEGHTDNIGDKHDLLELSIKRGEAVKAYLVRQGVAAARIRVTGYGDTRPSHDNTTESGRAANRRVEIRVNRVEK